VISLTTYNPVNYTFCWLCLAKKNLYLPSAINVVLWLPTQSSW